MSFALFYEIISAYVLNTLIRFQLREIKKYVCVYMLICWGSGKGTGKYGALKLVGILTVLVVSVSSVEASWFFFRRPSRVAFIVLLGLLWSSMVGRGLRMPHWPWPLSKPLHFEHGCNLWMCWAGMPTIVLPWTMKVGSVQVGWCNQGLLMAELALWIMGREIWGLVDLIVFCWLWRWKGIHASECAFLLEAECSSADSQQRNRDLVLQPIRLNSTNSPKLAWKWVIPQEAQDKEPDQRLHFDSVTP